MGNTFAIKRPPVYCVFRLEKTAVCPGKNGIDPETGVSARLCCNLWRRVCVYYGAVLFSTLVSRLPDGFTPSKSTFRLDFTHFNPIPL